MNGPSKSANEKGFDWMEWGIVFAGAMVVAGLFMESWPEIRLAIAERRFPNVPVTGGIIVAIGVLIEVALGIFITQRANRAQVEANTIIAETKERASRAEERAALAEQAAAEANLARAKLEQRMKPRMVLGPESEKFKELLIPHARKHLDIMIFDQHIQETTALAWQFLSLFRSANWNVRMYEPIGAQHRIQGAPLVLAIGIDAPIAMVELAVALLDRFKELDIECSVAPSSFGEVGKPRAFDGSFRLVKEDPLRIFGGKPVAPFRIQIGALQLVPVPPMKILIGRTAQEPPQT